MKTILIQTKTDRNKETRISTRKDQIELTVFFKGEDGQTRKEIVILKRTSDGSLRVENSNGLLLQTEGDEASKLNYK
jgi:hypothetical protein